MLWDAGVLAPFYPRSSALLSPEAEMLRAFVPCGGGSRAPAASRLGGSVGSW